MFGAVWGLVVICERFYVISERFYVGCERFYVIRERFFCEIYEVPMAIGGR